MKKQKLVIVESPAKAKTISKFLGAEFKVLASYGHIRDLPKSSLGINIEKNFEPQYVVSSSKYTKMALSEIKKNYKENTTELFIATDEDREGEAIGWHIVEYLKPKNKSDIKRIVFHEITKGAVINSLNNSRKIDLNLVNAQQARRVLDRLVGYSLSPLLWRKIQSGLSAGRVQSVAVKLIVEREEQIEKFSTSFNYKIRGEFINEEGELLIGKIESPIENYEEAYSVLEKSKDSKFSIQSIEKKVGKKSPQSPFTTSTLQQDASSKLGFSVKRTMIIAQKLYESGKITYMRTDSLNLSDEAISNISRYILEKSGDKYLQNRKYHTKSKGAQEAHEAIRPTDIYLESLKSDPDENRLYNLIWKRTVASQMKDAKIEKTQILIASDKYSYKFNSSDENILFDGFLKIYKTEDKTDEYKVKNFKESDNLKYKLIEAKQTYTKPLTRYSEASLVKMLEEKGIGRPSTYAPTVSTVQERNYVIKQDYDGQEYDSKVMTLEKNNIETIIQKEIVGAEKNKLFPTPIGKLVNDFLCTNFKDIVDYDFTARVENEFDEIAQGKITWNKMIKTFYKDFIVNIKKTQDNVTRAQATNTREIGVHPISGKPISVRIGRFGPFVQIGSKADDEKPLFAKISKELNFETITLKEALELFNLPKILGKDEEGNDIIVNNGRFGPYAKYKEKFYSIKDNDPMTISLDQVLLLIQEKSKDDQNKTLKEFPNSDVKILNGIYGPYIKNGKKNIKIPKNISDPTLMTLDECIKLSNTKKTFRKRNISK